MDIKNSKSKRSNTGWKGINFQKRHGKFEAQVCYISKIRRATNTFYVGSYLTLKEAIEAREQFIKNLF